MGRLAGRVVIVTGGASGIGAATARMIVGEGGSVVVADRNGSLAAELASELGEKRCAFELLDVADPDAWRRVVEQAEERFGAVSGLVNAAGMIVMHATVDAVREDYQRVVDVNLLGVVFGIQAVHESMLRAGGGSIVNVASVAGKAALPGIASYVASKWAVRGATRAAALELASDGIRVNAVLPGHIETPMNPQEFDGIPLGRKGLPDEVASAIVHLLSAESSYTSGTDVVVAGGLDITF